MKGINNPFYNQDPQPYNGDEPYMFVSYSKKDYLSVRKIINQFQHDRLRVCFGYELMDNSEWNDTVAEYINNCEFFLAIMSYNYERSEECRTQLRYARNLDKKRNLANLEDALIPIVIASKPSIRLTTSDPNGGVFIPEPKKKERMQKVPITNRVNSIITGEKHVESGKMIKFQRSARFHRTPISKTRTKHCSKHTTPSGKKNIYPMFDGAVVHSKTPYMTTRYDFFGTLYANEAVQRCRIITP